ncbi:unnamed protein product [Cutaneotrichosporon oleaginosum]
MGQRGQMGQGALHSQGGVRHTAHTHSLSPLLSFPPHRQSPLTHYEYRTTHNPRPTPVTPLPPPPPPRGHSPRLLAHSSDPPSAASPSLQPSPQPSHSYHTPSFSTSSTTPLHPLLPTLAFPSSTPSPPPLPKRSIVPLSTFSLIAFARDILIHTPTPASLSPSASSSHPPHSSVCPCSSPKHVPFATVAPRTPALLRPSPPPFTAGRSSTSPSAIIKTPVRAHPPLPSF